ncbi:unnamed protein product [Cuscuta europaea]|uniref:At1g61320/AtMIF1 LRR domain-containing protein n=1 Tax=Cuscuta europaea TaxID=41803 RepID=A0A9P0YXH4_CUSEU|nr:unnamed protein product [Cuscuta europaea]
MREKSLAKETPESGESDVRKEEFGAEDLEIDSHENVRTNNLIRVSIDRISALPDCLLVHIISLLGMKEAATTSILGKRWQFLWAELPTLQFDSYDWAERKESKNTIDFVAWVNRIIATRRGNYLEKMMVNFNYEDCFSTDVDNWIQFALENNVKEVSLRMDYSQDDFYILREMMYSSSSLTSLYLEGCILDPQRTIKWWSLTKLEISGVNLPQPVVEKILSGCPVLNFLDLSECWGFTCLEINSQSLRELRIRDSEDEENEGFLQISAPYITNLSLWLYPMGRQINLKDISSLVSANIDFIEPFWDFILPEELCSTQEFFEKIHHVKELELGPEPLKALAALVLNGWQHPKYKLRCLEIDFICRAGKTIPGILDILESSPDIETLIMRSFDPEGVSVNFLILDSWYDFFLSQVINIIAMYLIIFYDKICIYCGTPHY